MRKGEWSDKNRKMCSNYAILCTMKFTWKSAVFVAVIGVAVLGGIWFEASKPAAREMIFKQTDYTGWKSYHNEALDITIKYPPGFFVDAEKLAERHPDMSEDLKKISQFAIYSDNFDPEAGTVAPNSIDLVQVVQIEQPVVPNAPKFTRIRDLFFSDVPFVLTRKSSPNLELVRINGMEAIWQEGAVNEGLRGLAGSRHESVYLIHDGRLISIDVLENRYSDGILNSIHFD